MPWPSRAKTWHSTMSYSKCPVLSEKTAYWTWHQWLYILLYSMQSDLAYGILFPQHMEPNNRAHVFHIYKNNLRPKSSFIQVTQQIVIQNQVFWFWKGFLHFAHESFQGKLRFICCKLTTTSSVTALSHTAWKYKILVLSNQVYEKPWYMSFKLIIKSYKTKHVMPIYEQNAWIWRRFFIASIGWST